MGGKILNLCKQIFKNFKCYLWFYFNFLSYWKIFEKLKLWLPLAQVLDELHAVLCLHYANLYNKLY